MCVPWGPANKMPVLQEEASLWFWRDPPAVLVSGWLVPGAVAQEEGD